MFSCKQGQTSGSNIAKKMFWWNYFCTNFGSGQEVCFGPSRPDPEGTLGTRMGPGRAGMAPTSGPGWVRNAVKQSTWRIWTGPIRTRDGTWTGPGSDPGKGLDGTPRNSNRLLGLSDNYKDYCKNSCSEELFCNNFGQDGTPSAKTKRGRREGDGK